MASTTAADCAQALIHQWIARFGVPTHITSDRGPQFTSALCAGIFELSMGSVIRGGVYSTPYFTLVPCRRNL